MLVPTVASGRQKGTTKEESRLLSGYPRFGAPSGSFCPLVRRRGRASTVEPKTGCARYRMDAYKIGVGEKYLRQAETVRNRLTACTNRRDMLQALGWRGVWWDRQDCAFVQAACCAWLSGCPRLLCLLDDEEKETGGPSKIRFFSVIGTPEGD